MKEILNNIIKELLQEKLDPTIQLGEYFLTGDPIYLSKNARKYDIQVDRMVLMEYLAEKLINDYRTEQDNKGN